MNKDKRVELNGLFECGETDHDLIVWLRDPDYQKQLYLSQGFESIFGDSPNKLYEDPLSFKEYLRSENKDLIVEKLKGRSDEEGKNSMVFQIMNTKTKALTFIHDKAFYLYDKQGIHVATAGVARPITEREADALIVSQKGMSDDVQWIAFRKEIMARVANTMRLEMNTAFNPINLLSMQQKSCIALLCQGLSSKEIGQILNIHYRTVEGHLRKAKERLNCKKSAELAYLYGKMRSTQ